MKPRSQRLQVVLDLALRKEEQALALLKQARAQHAEQQHQLRNLQNYRQNTIQDLKTTHDNFHRADRLQSYQQFISHVDQAIKQQQGVVDNAAGRVEEASSEWQQCHQKRKGMEDLISRYRQQETMARDKAEQKLAEDAILGRMAFRHRQ